MVNPEIRKLQFLNDLITQTLDVISQRGPVTAWTGGLSHSPYTADASSLYGVGNLYPSQSLLGAAPFMQQQIPSMMGNLSHTPFPVSSYVPGYGVNPNLAGLGANLSTPWIQGGLSHTPFGLSALNAPFQSLYANPLMHQRFAAGAGFPIW